MSRKLQPDGLAPRQGAATKSVVWLRQGRCRRWIGQAVVPAPSDRADHQTSHGPRLISCASDCNDRDQKIRGPGGCDELRQLQSRSRGSFASSQYLFNFVASEFQNLRSHHFESQGNSDPSWSRRFSAMHKALRVSLQPNRRKGQASGWG